MPGSEILQELEDVDTDVSGTAQRLPDFQNFTSPSENLPESDLGGELTPQAYDVRANVINSPENEQGGEETGFWSKIGRALTNYVNNPEPMQQQPANVPSIEEQQVEMQEGLNPMETPQPNNVYEGLGKLNQPPAPMAEQGTMIPSPVPPPQMEQPESPELAPPAEQKKEPGTYVDLGAAQTLYSSPDANPDVKREIERIFDISLTPERARQISEFETAIDGYIQKLNGVDVALSKREKQLMDKVANKDLSPSEQVSMALALLAPAIIGGIIGGKEGFVGALSGGATSIANILGKREKGVEEAQELLPEIALEKSKIEKEKVGTQQQARELRKKIQDDVPNMDLRKLFQKDGMVVNGKLVLNTGNPLLPLKSTAVRNAKDFDTFREKTMPQLSEKVSTTQQGLHLLDNLNELIDISDGQKKGVTYDYLPYWDTAANSFKALVPAGRDTFRDENGNEVKISELYESTLEQLSDMYSQAVGAAGSKTAFKTYREHFREMISNPFTIGSLAKGRTQSGTVKGQINSVKKKFEENIISKLDAAGVETDPVKQLFSKSEINTTNSENRRKKDRAQSAVEQTLMGK